MANAHGKQIDKTHLSLDQAEERGFLHRDYIAHCLRWTHVVKYLNQQHRYKTAKILDIGCGREVPLAKTMYSSKMSPEKYCGVDVNKLEVPEMLKKQTKFEVKLISNDLCNLTETDIGFKANIATCFEVIEHVEPEHGFNMLLKIKELMTEDGTLFLSTPCYDHKVGAADNHVNEMTHDVVGHLLEKAGFRIEAVYGTFASQRDYKESLLKRYGDSGLKIFEDLREFYDSNYLATLFAPIFPKESRNCLWQVKLDKSIPLKYNNVNEFTKPYGSSSKWENELKLIGE